MENSIERASKYSGSFLKNQPQRSITTANAKNAKRDFIIATLASEFLNV
jgi:hypothetical protein